MKTLILTVHDAVGCFFDAMRIGVPGYLLKSAADEELVAAVLTVAEGKSFLDPKVTHMVLERFRVEPGSSVEPWPDELTERERETLVLVAEGMSNRDIGDRLGVSPRTVEVHLSRVYKKLGASSRTEAALAAVRGGIIEID